MNNLSQSLEVLQHTYGQYVDSSSQYTLGKRERKRQEKRDRERQQKRVRKTGEEREREGQEKRERGTMKYEQERKKSQTFIERILYQT